MRGRTLGLVLITLVDSLGLGGCSGRGLDVSGRPDVVEARSVLDGLVRGEVEELEPRLADPLRVTAAAEQLRALAALFPKTAPSGVRVVSYQTRTQAMVGGATTELSDTKFESAFGSVYVLTEVALTKVDGGPFRIVALHAQPLPGPLNELNGFSILDMGFVQYAWIVAMCAVAATTIAALRAWFRRRSSLARRWWWLLGILVGAFKFSVNWITGGIFIQALTVQLFSLSATRTEGLPWILSFSIPAGAIAFLIVSRRSIGAPIQAAEGPPTVGSPEVRPPEPRSDQ